MVDEALREHPVIDGHNDWAWVCREERDYSVEGLELPLHTDTDIPRLRTGGVGGQFWSVWIPDDRPGPEALLGTLEQIDWVQRLIARYPEHFAAARTAVDIRAAMADGRIASLLGAEGGHSLADSPAALRVLASLGVRYLTLTHTKTTSWADSGTDEPRHGGLSERGREYVRELNRLGMLVDLSHTSPATAHAALDVSTSPVIFSHSSCAAVTDHPRNVPDDVLARLEDNGGVLMCTFVPQFLSVGYARWHDGDRSNPAPIVGLAEVADHIEHAREVAGIRHIGLGGDFDGTDEFPQGIEGVDGYPALLRELARRGWTAEELGALTSGNILRVLERTDAAFTSPEGPPSLLL
ncbi:membrane dipeptidase [Naasia lichenicola]|uniref:Membrane dipeptidase n=1 Tax=Naasia lichenicola TaxID=2565933 RepID=A0A4S4FNF9_9MICO|nr:membrane dipeptidase [Naasia lichenicola]